MHMGAGNNDDDEEFEYVYLSNYRFRLQGTFILRGISLR